MNRSIARKPIIDPNSPAGCLIKVKNSLNNPEMTHIGSSDLGSIVRSAQSMGMEMPADFRQDPMRPGQFKVEVAEKFIGAYEEFIGDQFGMRKKEVEPLAMSGDIVETNDDPINEKPVLDDDIVIPEPVKGSSGVEIPDPLAKSAGNPELPKNKRGPSQVPPAPASRLKIMSKTQLHIECMSRNIEVSDDATKPHMLGLIQAHDEETAATRNKSIIGDGATKSLITKDGDK